MKSILSALIAASLFCGAAVAQNAPSIPNRIVVETYMGEQSRVYHFTKRISDARGFHSKVCGTSAELDIAVKVALENVSKLPGVDHVLSENYEVKIYIGKAFRWSEVEAAILTQLKSIYGKDAVVEITNNAREIGEIAPPNAGRRFHHAPQHHYKMHGKKVEQNT